MRSLCCRIVVDDDDDNLSLTYTVANGRSNVVIDQIPVIGVGLRALGIGAATRARVTERDVGLGGDSEEACKKSNCSGGGEGLHFVSAMYSKERTKAEAGRTRKSEDRDETEVGAGNVEDTRGIYTFDSDEIVHGYLGSIVAKTFANCQGSREYNEQALASAFGRGGFFCSCGRQQGKRSRTLR